MSKLADTLRTSLDLELKMLRAEAAAPSPSPKHLAYLAGRVDGCIGAFDWLLSSDYEGWTATRELVSAAQTEAGNLRLPAVPGAAP